MELPEDTGCPLAQRLSVSAGEIAQIMEQSDLSANDAVVDTL